MVEVRDDSSLGRGHSKAWTKVDRSRDPGYTTDAELLLRAELMAMVVIRAVDKYFVFLLEGTW